MRIICKTELRAFHKTTILKHKGLQRASSLLEDGGEAGKPGGENEKHYLVVRASFQVLENSTKIGTSYSKQIQKWSPSI